LVRDDPGHGVAATVVIAEHLAEEAPDGRDRIENPVPKLDAVDVEDVEDVGFGQNIRKGKSRAACETSTDRLEVRHGVAFRIV
jgi:hypothetical protein